jgi:hypothetical protein
MKFAGVVLLIACGCWPDIGAAQSAVDTERIATMMVRLCVGGGHTEVIGGAATGGAEMSLRSLDVTGNLKGEFNIKKSSAEGLVDGINGAMSQVSADQADKVRACLQPVRDRLLDLMLPGGNHSSSGKTAPTVVQTTSGANSPAIANVHGNVTITGDQ